MGGRSFPSYGRLHARSFARRLLVGRDCRPRPVAKVVLTSSALALGLVLTLAVRGAIYWALDAELPTLERPVVIRLEGPVNMVERESDGSTDLWAAY